MAVKVSVARAWNETNITWNPPLISVQANFKSSSNWWFQNRYFEETCLWRVWEETSNIHIELDKRLVITRIIEHLQNLKSSAEFLPKKCPSFTSDFLCFLHLGQQGRYLHEHTPTWNVADEWICRFCLTSSFFLKSSSFWVSFSWWIRILNMWNKLTEVCR